MRSRRMSASSTRLVMAVLRAVSEFQPYDQKAALTSS
jgi:hypothetical protein